MNKNWSDDAWDDYEYWQKQDRKTLRKINNLLKDIERNGVNKGIGRPERLKYEDAWSREIDDTNRLLYDIIGGRLYIYACRGHYDDK
jgi:toxin YoeB